jgi:2',3'-cyclic-nucleotide 2'-phosphodiesterase / 3'-nucleotidase
MRRSMSVLVLAALVLPLLSAAPIASAQGETKTITILETSDLHGNIMPWDYYANRSAEWGLAKVATLIKQERAQNPNTLLIDNGDTIQGTPLTYYYNLLETQSVHPMAATMNVLRFDSTTLGNHEFNYGPGVLNRWTSQLNFPALSANTRKTDGGEAFQPYLIKEVDGVQVGILGLTTPAIPNWEKPGNIEGLRWDDPIATAKQYVPKIRAEGADLIVIAQHSGWSKAPADSAKPESWLTDPSTWQPTGSLPGENVTIELAQQVPGVDIILAGHSHLDVPKAVINGVLIAEPSYWGRALSKFTVQMQGSGSDWQVVGKDATNLSTRGVAADAEIMNIAAGYHDQTIKYISTPIGTATSEFSGGPKARYTDSALGDLINTVQSEAAAAAGYPVDLSLAAIFTDAGMIPQGQITLRDAYSVYIYDNTLYVMEITGDILRRALEKNAEYFKQVDPNNLPADPKGVVADNARDYNWDLYTGIEYTIDLTRPVGQRVTKLRFAGKDLAPNQTLRIAINNYRASGGGGYAMFREGKILWQSTNEVRDLMAEYVKAKGSLNPQQINQANFTLVPDLYAAYFGANPNQPSPQPSAQPSPAPGQPAVPVPSAPPAGGQIPVPVTLPNTGGDDLLWLLPLAALGALGAGAALRRRSTTR